MKTLRKSMLLILVAVFSLAIGLFAAACGGSKVTLSFDWGENRVDKFEVAPGEEMQLPANGDRDGYFFMGWYDNSSYTGTKYEDKLTAPEKDTTYYARWAKGYTITLDIETGGTIDGGLSVLVPEGGNILEYLNGHTASMSGLAFGAWFNGDTEITSESSMPAADLTLTAKFKADYTVKVFTQEQPYGTTYAENSELSYTGQEYVGKQLSLASRTIPNYVINHNYVGADGSKTIEELAISKNSAENLFVLYCDRESYTIIYDANAPQGKTVIGKMADQRFVYEEKASALENGFSVEGCLFAGWSTDRSGSIKYQPGEELEGASYTLYAIWDIGYADMFGGSDYLYFPRLTPDTVVLMRGDYRMEGTFDSATSIATFGDLKAKVLGDKFAFYSEARAASYKLYSGYTDGKIETTQLTLDGYFGATLSDGSTGTISYDAANGCYTLDIGGRTSDILFSEVNGENVFMYIGSEAGTYTAYELRGKSTELLFNAQLQFTLDGVGGIVRYNLATGMRSSGTYEQPDMLQEPVPFKATLTDGEKVEFLLYNGIALVKNQTYSDVYTLKDGKDVIYLDGYNGMVGSYYTPDGKDAIECNYYIENSILGDIAHILPMDGSDELAFLLKNEGDKKTYEATSVFTSYRMIAGTVVGNDYTNQFLPLVMIIKEEAYNGEGAPSGAKVASLYYDDSISDVEEVTTEELYDGYVIDNIGSMTEPFSTFKAVGESKTNIEELQIEMPYTEFYFHTSDQFGIGNVFYTYGEAEVTDEDGTTTKQKDYMVYEDLNGQGQLIVGSLNAAEGYGVEGFGSFYKTSSGYIEGGVSAYYSQSLDTQEFGVYQYLVFQVRNQMDYSLVSYYYAAYGETDTKIEMLSEPPRFLTRIFESATESVADDYVSLKLDGKGNAVYYQSREDAESRVNKVEGTYSFVTKIQIGSYEEDLYMFNSSDINFTFVLNSMIPEGYNLESEVWEEGSYTLTNGETLELDGYGAYARYTDKYGNVIEGLYLYQESGDARRLVIYDPNNTDQQGGIIASMAFDVDAEKNITVLTMESQAQYWLLINSAYEYYFGRTQIAISFTEGKYVSLVDINTGEAFGTGTYDALDSEGRYLINVILNANNESHEWTVQLSVYAQQIPVCMIQDEDVFGSYLAGDSSVIYFDGFGGGFMVSPDGYRTEAGYRVLDDDYAVFETDEEGEIFVVKYNKTAKTFEVVNKDEKTYRTYYSSEFTAVEFGEVLRINGTVVAYWFLEGDKPVYYSIDQETGELKRLDTIPYEYKPDAETYEIGEGDNKVTYSRWKGTEEFTLKGKLVFDAFNKAENGENKGEWGDMELTFKPDGTSELNAPATFKFKHENEEQTYTGIYRVVMEFANTSSSTLHFTYLVCENVSLRLEMNYKGNTTEENTFVLHAAVTQDMNFLDYIGENGGRRTGTIYVGTSYTIGMKSWPVTNWDEKTTALLYGRLNIFDVKGQYLSFEVNYYDAMDEDNIIGTDQNFGSSIYRILTKGSDDVEYSVNIELISTGSYYVFIPYSICVYKEVDGDNGDKYVVEQFISSYQTEEFPFLGVWTCKILKNGSTGEENDLLKDYETNIWDTNIVLSKYKGEDKDSKKPEYYVVWFELDENNHVKKGHYREGSSLTVEAEDFQLEAVVVYDSNGNNIDGFIPLKVSKKDTAGKFQEIALAGWEYDKDSKSYTIVYSVSQTSQDFKAIKISITGTKGNATLTVEDIDVNTLGPDEDEGN